MTLERRRSLAFAVAVLLAVPPAYAQVSPYGETIEVSIVNVDVVVTDKNGNRVRGLTKDDFEIREDGKAQPITNFAEYAPERTAPAGTVTVEAAAARQAEPAAAALPPVKRTIVLYLEGFTLPDFHAKPFFDGLRNFLRRVVRPGDAVAIVTSTPRFSLVRQEFTDNLMFLEEALEKVEAESTGPADDLTAALRRQAALEEALQADVLAAGYTVDAGASEEFAARAEAVFEMFRVRQKTETLKSFMKSMAGIEGKKIMILAMHRFGVYAGAEFFDGAVPMRYQGELDTRAYREQLTKLANANGITLYPVHPEGMTWTPRTDAMEVRANVFAINSDADLARSARDNNILMNETGALTELAGRTGGLMHYGSRNIVDLLPQIADDLESYYSLAYRATGSGKDDVRRVSVKAKNPAYEVRARRQFVDKTDAERMGDRVIANLFQPQETTKIPLDIELGTITKKGAHHWLVPLKVRVPISELTTIDGPDGPSGQFSVFLATGGVLGVIAGVNQHKQPFSIAPTELERARRSYFTYETTLEVDDMTRHISVGVLDELSREFALERITIDADVLIEHGAGE